MFNLRIPVLTLAITCGHLIDHEIASPLGELMNQRSSSKPALEIGTEITSLGKITGSAKGSRKSWDTIHDLAEPGLAGAALKGEGQAAFGATNRAPVTHRTQIATKPMSARANPQLPLDSYLKVKNELEAVSSKTSLSKSLETAQHYIGVLLDMYEAGFTKPRNLQIAGYCDDWLAEKRARDKHLNVDILKEIVKRICLGSLEADVVLVPDVSNPAGWKELMKKSFKSYNDALEYALEKIGQQEYERRKEVSEAQYHEMTIVLHWNQTMSKIAEELGILEERVREVGEHFGGKVLFPSFDQVAPAESLKILVDLEKSEPRLYEKWQDFLGAKTLKRRLELLKSLKSYGRQNVLSDQLSAWQMQGMEVNKMLKALCFSQPSKFGEIEHLAITEEALLRNERRYKTMSTVFLQGTRYSSCWSTTIEHDQLLHLIPTSHPYREVHALMEKMEKNRALRSNVKDSSKSSSEKEITQVESEKEKTKTPKLLSSRSSRFSGNIKGLLFRNRSLPPQLEILREATKIAENLPSKELDLGKGKHVIHEIVQREPRDFALQN